MHTKLRVLALPLVMALGACHDLTGNPEVTPKGLKEAVRSAGFIPYDPIRSGRGPGFLYVGSVDRPDIVCPSVYGTRLEPQRNPDSPMLSKEKLGFQTVSKDSGYSFNASVSLLEDLIGKDNSAKLDLGKFSNSGKLTISWGQVDEYSLPRSAKYDDKGVKIKANADCAQALRDMVTNGKLKSVMLVRDAVAVTGLKYKFEGLKSGEAGLGISIGKILDGKIGDGKWKWADESTLELNTLMFVGYQQPKPLLDYDVDGLMAGEMVTLDLKLTP